MFAFSRVCHSLKQGARSTGIAQDALPEDPVATERARKLDAMAVPQERQSAPVLRFERDVGNFERDHS